MPDEHAYGDAIHDAERAAAAGDFAAAESALRRALDLQEGVLGAAHPELASTLNNLAVVCETNGRLDDAEQFYRRACAVATAALPPGDALVETSRANLEDFCRAHGRPIDDWPELDRGAPQGAPPAAASAPAVAAPVAAPVPAATRSAATSRVTAHASAAPRHFVAALAVLAAVATVALAWFVFAPRETTSAEAPASAAAPSDAQASPAVTTPAAPAPANTTPPPPAALTPVTAAAGTPPAEPRPASAATPTTARAAPTVPATPPGAARSSPAADTVEAAPPSRDAAARLVEADVCARLARQGRRWTCTPAGDAVAPGAVSFYTRVAVARAARIEHRWYRNDALARAITLSVGASAADGYRTFSQQTVTPGRWRVEARTSDGQVLREVRFEVRD